MSEKIKIKKSRLQEIIQEEYARYETLLKEQIAMDPLGKEPETDEEEDYFSEDDLKEALAEVIGEEGLGDGLQMGGNYNAGAGGTSVSGGGHTNPVIRK